MVETDINQRAAKLFRDTQKNYCTALEKIDGRGTFITDSWDRTNLNNGAKEGGGITRIMSDGKTFERAGVNFSEVYGIMEPFLVEKLIGVRSPHEFFATGISLVVHPLSPMIPTTHANCRFLQIGDFSWFGGGADLTPYYLFEEDACHFHTELKAVCDKFDPFYYEKFKKWCDEYFFLPHRKEARGIGGIFFDYLGKEDGVDSLNKYFLFVEALCEKLSELYLPVVKKRQQEPWSTKEKDFQLLRRGRYVEFNLLHDRGTHFGLQTNGRIESIFMSLPPIVKWEYNSSFEDGSLESKLIDVLKQPRDWINKK